MEEGRLRSAARGHRAPAAGLRTGPGPTPLAPWASALLARSLARSLSLPPISPTLTSTGMGSGPRNTALNKMVCVFRAPSESLEGRLAWAVLSGVLLGGGGPGAAATTGQEPLPGKRTPLSVSLAKAAQGSVLKAPHREMQNSQQERRFALPDVLGVRRQSILVLGAGHRRHRSLRWSVVLRNDLKADTPEVAFCGPRSPCTSVSGTCCVLCRLGEKSLWGHPSRYLLSLWRSQPT